MIRSSYRMEGSIALGRVLPPLGTGAGGVSSPAMFTQLATSPSCVGEHYAEIFQTGAE